MWFQPSIILLSKIMFQLFQVKKVFIRNQLEFYSQLQTKRSIQINSRPQLIHLLLIEMLKFMICSWILLKHWWLIQKCLDMKINNQKVSTFSIGKTNQSKEQKCKFLREIRQLPTITWTRTVFCYSNIDAEKASTETFMKIN